MGAGTLAPCCVPSLEHITVWQGAVHGPIYTLEQFLPSGAATTLRLLTWAGRPLDTARSQCSQAAVTEQSHLGTVRQNTLVPNFSHAPLFSSSYLHYTLTEPEITPK